MFKKLIITSLLTLTSFGVFAKPAVVCTNFANFAYSVVGAREGKVDRLQLKDQVKLVIEEKKIKNFTMQDYQELSRIVDILYSHPEVTADYAGQSYFSYCLTKDGTDI